MYDVFFSDVETSVVGKFFSVKIKNCCLRTTKSSLFYTYVSNEHFSNADMILF